MPTRFGNWYKRYTISFVKYQALYEIGKTIPIVPRLVKVGETDS